MSEHCSVCGRSIDEREQPYVRNDRVICSNCHYRLSRPAPRENWFVRAMNAALSVMVTGVLFILGVSMILAAPPGAITIVCLFIVVFAEREAKKRKK